MITAPAEQQTQSKSFLGWRMVALAILAGAFTGPGQTVGVSVFIDSFISDLSLSRDQVSLAYLIGTMAGATAMPLVGQLIDRHGVRRAQLVIATLFGLALLNMSFVQSWVWLALGFVFIRMLGQGSLSMVSTVTVAVWFDQLRGRAIGLTGVGVAAGIATTPILLNLAINEFGLRAAWRIAAIAVPAILIPAAWFFLVSRPSDVGQVPDGTIHQDDPSQSVTPSWGYSRAEAVRIPSFWVIGSVTTLTSMLVTGLNFHAISLFVQNGLTKDEAALMFLPQILGATVAGLLLGLVVDQTNGRLLPAVSMLALTGSHLLATNLTSTTFVVVYALSLGVTAGFARTVSSSLLAKWFGSAHIGSLNGLLSLMGVAGSALGPITLSLAQGRLGSYASAALLLAALPAMAAVAAFVVTPPPSRAAG